MRKDKSLIRYLPPLLLIFSLLIASVPAFAQSGDRAARAAQWDGYQLPAGKFTRFVDRQKGFSFRIPADWKQSPWSKGGVIFKPASEVANLIALTEEIPEGSGVANYVSGVMQSFRNEPIKPESATVRRVMSGGLEWREIAHEIEGQNGANVRQTMWFTAVGSRAYGLALSVQNGEIETYEPIFKRVIASVRIGAAGHWDEEFETLRAAFTAGSNSETSEIEAATVAEALRAGRESLATAAGRIAELLAKSPDAAIDLITDADPQARTAAIIALGRSTHPQAVDLLIWALSDKDLFASSAAAQALAARGAQGLAAIKGKLAALAENPSAIVRTGVAMGESASRELIEELLRSDGAKQHVAALRLALTLEKFDLRLPYSKLLASTDPGAPHTLVALLQRHAGAEAANELSRFLRTDDELWAARALGEIGSAGVAQEMNKRIAEIDAQLEKLGKAVNKTTAPKKGRKKSNDKKGDKKDDSSETFSLTTVAEFKTKPEDVRLAMLRGQLDTAARKIKFRDRWNQAKTEAERRAVKSEINKDHDDLAEWAELSLTVAAPAPVNVANLDLTKLKDAPATGETLFPKNTFSYAMAPDFAATMDKIDSALSGVQMATVRDQMTFALILKALKAALASKLGVDATGDASKATGVDLKSPIALASWQSISGGNGGGATHSAVTVRVADRARFERLLATYQESLGDFDQFFTMAAAMSRFAGIIPAAVPVIYASIASDEARGIAKRVRSSTESKIPSLKPFAHAQQESVNGMPVTVLIKPVISEAGGARWEKIFIAYLGDTAVVSPSREAIADLLAAGTSGETIARGEAFAKARAEKGEIVFFSRLNDLLKPLFDLAESKDETDQIAAFIKAFGVESGALQLTQHSWETVFRIGLADNEFTKSFKPFKVDALAAPRELLPRSTILYVGAVVDPPKLHSVLKSLDSVPGAVATGSGANARDKEIDADIEKLIVPNMQGEMAAALVSLKPIFDGAEWPAMALALKLNNGELAEAHRAGKLFANFKRAPNATALGSPITALGEDDDAPFVAVTNDYFILADSVETLKMFEAKEKFASSRDFERSTKELPGDLALFATYGLEAALDEASKVVTDSSSQQMLPFISAVIHAFHSQRAYFAVEKDGLAGRLSVSFDREGRYSVGDLANGAGDFDLANAMITPKGLTVIQSPRVEAMTLRVTAKTPGVAPRVRDDLAKFNFQRVESSDDSTVVVTSSARRIPEKLTVHLPVMAVTGAEFAPFLNPTTRINSKNPQVVALAKQIAGDDKDGRSVARKIGEWTYKNLKWKKVESDSVDTLASREADCLEHSELYVALARALGLPARVVTGAALSGGSFGAHAWVEIYLGKWVELDPTWGLMDHVDATHLRFDGDAFTSYAMLNQIELEITSARRAVADYQRDPIRLVKEFSLDPATRDLAFDLSLAVEQSLGQSRWEKLDERQRAAVISAFEKTVSEMWETWKAEIPLQPRALQSDVKADRATITLLRGEALLRFTLARRNGAWFITEHEIVDDALPEFADAIQGALQPGSRRGLVFETSIENAARHIEKLIAQEGEKPELLLLKSRVLSSQEIEEAAKTQGESETNKTEPSKDEAGKDPSKPAKPAKSAEPAKPDQPASDPSVEVLKEIAKRWPDFAPARLALARELLYSDSGEDAVNPLSKDAERAIAELHAYARLAPYDPRPWRDLAFAYEQFEKLEDAESALEKAVELDREYLDHHAALVNLHLTYDNPEKAKPAFARMLKVSSDVDEIFGQFVDEEGYDPDYAKSLENLLLAFPKQLEGSGVGWILLAGVQDSQNKIGDAIKSMQRAVAIEPSASSYEVLSRLYRSQRRFTEALNAANQAAKLEEDSVDAHFERACSLAQLGRKREALAALKQMLEIDPDTVFDPEEPDLQPLATMPEFKAMKEKMKEATAPSTETKEETKGETKKTP
jgi:transglutaminase-like putative cysteine protease/tetratricopeptide (TPR) repeat protein